MRTFSIFDKMKLRRMIRRSYHVIIDIDHADPDITAYVDKIMRKNTFNVYKVEDGPNGRCKHYINYSKKPPAYRIVKKCWLDSNILFCLDGTKRGIVNKVEDI